MQKRPILLCCAMLVILAYAETGAEISLTVYHNDCAVVTDARDVEFQPGRDTIPFYDVAAFLDPTSISLVIDHNSGGIEVLKQQFHYDRADADTFIARYLGRIVEVLTVDDERLAGKLLSAGERIALLLSGGSIRVFDWGDLLTLSLPQPTAEFYPRPTIVWHVETQTAGRHTCTARYLTQKINWRAEYSAILGGDDSTLQLAGWAAVDNQTGASFKDARLKLVAGDAGLVLDRGQLRGARLPQRLDAEFEGTAGLSTDSPSSGLRGFFEHQLLAVNQPVTIDDGQITQIPFLPPREITVRKVYTFEPAKRGHQVQVNLEFDNSAAAGLGMFLPQGKIRVLAEDLDGSPELVGEGWIAPTPAVENVRCVISSTAEIVGQRAVMDRRRVDKRFREEDIEISLHNHKKEEVTVTVVERMRGEWRITKSSHKYRRRNVDFVEFDLVVAPSGEEVLTYSVRSR